MLERFAPIGLVVVACALVGCSPIEDSFVSSPYLQNTTTTSTVLTQASQYPETLTVEVTPDSGGSPTLQFTEPTPTTHHRIPLTGLAPDTLYRYKVLAAGGTIANSTLRTAPPADGRPITLAAVGDSGQTFSRYAALRPLDETIEAFDGESQARNATVELFAGRTKLKQGLVVSRMIQDNPSLDLILHTGDVVCPDGAWGQYREAFFEPFGPIIDHVPLFASMGNHDVKTNGGAPWDAAFVTPANNPEGTPRYYSFDYGPVHFTALDVQSHTFTAGSPMVDWLTLDLASAHAPWKVVFFHAPPFSESHSGGNTFEQQALVPIFEAAKVDLVLNGHDHAYQRFFPINGVTYVVTGGGGQTDLHPVTPSPMLAKGLTLFHYVRATIDRQHLTLEAVDLWGHVFDTVELVK